ncbi:hypothetical protein [Arsenophonus nasoniae]|uniref:Uncharacterized protein n=1 Tax=Arsenophonus nasoniae TaxID=638 RepID=A0AA95K0I9_9GAMM|nr:hypothetical protein [Arsenophonus nasoniae]WGL94876.1 hypothetical protein QE207_14470 [Arsenophonus nasoniae]
MTRLNLVKTLQLGNEENGFIRYEIFSKDAEHYDYPQKIVVYHEKELNNSGDKCWVKSSDKISLEHLGFQHNSGLQRTVAINMPPI